MMRTPTGPDQSLPLRPASARLASSSLSRGPTEKVALTTCASPSGSVTLMVPTTVGSSAYVQVGSDSSTMLGGVPPPPGCAVSPAHAFQAVALWQALVSMQPATATQSTKTAAKRTRRTANDTA